MSGQGFMYCWHRTSDSNSNSCVEGDADSDIWRCANALATSGKIFQSTRISRAEIIACMHQKSWEEFEIVPS